VRCVSAKIVIQATDSGAEAVPPPCNLWFASKCRNRWKFL